MRPEPARLEPERHRKTYGRDSRGTPRPKGRIGEQDDRNREEFDLEGPRCPDDREVPEHRVAPESTGGLRVAYGRHAQEAGHKADEKHRVDSKKPPGREVDGYPRGRGRIAAQALQEHGAAQDEEDGYGGFAVEGREHDLSRPVVAAGDGEDRGRQDPLRLRDVQYEDGVVDRNGHGRISPQPVELGISSGPGCRFDAQSGRSWQLGRLSESAVGAGCRNRDRGAIGSAETSMRVGSKLRIRRACRWKAGPCYRSTAGPHRRQPSILSAAESRAVSIRNL